MTRCLGTWSRTYSSALYCIGVLKKWIMLFSVRWASLTIISCIPIVKSTGGHDSWPQNIKGLTTLFLLTVTESWRSMLTECIINLHCWVEYRMIATINPHSTSFARFLNRIHESQVLLFEDESQIENWPAPFQHVLYSGRCETLVVFK